MAVTTSTALAVGALAATAVGTGVAIYSQQKQAETQEEIARHNVKLANAEARNREFETREQIIRERRRKRRRLATLRNQLAGSGFLTTSGTPLAILGEENSNTELAIQDAHRRSNIEAASLRAQGQMGLWEAGQFSSAARLSSAGTALRGASSLASSYVDFSYQGVF